MELYKACVAADQDAKLNPYFCLFFRHQDSVLMVYLCRIIISNCKDRELGRHSRSVSSDC
ncbi:unnamed protein product [Dibothriocephalus latus]|uniref:Uncharacterized protein n=1 Tax=Dibothriocephalus latus TaxID=60516 RepID=A0A3P7LQ42_DIBLA|nr:unnamed protein product [Dibothriocephalus latus]